MQPITQLYRQVLKTPHFTLSPQDSAFHFVSTRSSIMIKMPIFSTGKFLLGQVTILEVQTVCTALIGMCKAKRRNQRKKGQRRYNCMNLTEGKLMEIDRKKWFLDEGRVQEKVTDFPLPETIKGSLDRVREGIIALSFCIHHMPNNYCRTGLLLQYFFSVLCRYFSCTEELSFTHWVLLGGKQHPTHSLYSNSDRSLPLPAGRSANIVTKLFCILLPRQITLT